MKNGLFITREDLYEKDALANGVIKKILNQIFVLNIEGQLSCKPLVLPKPTYNPVFLFISYLSFDVYKRMHIDPHLYDFIYIRRISPVNYSFLKLLKMIRKGNEKCKIIYEIPTYPYDYEHKTLYSKFNLFIDKIFREKLKKYVDRVITVSNDNEIFGIPAIKIKNGICCAEIQIRMPKTFSEDLNLIAVAQFALWHGYDRLIKGIYDFKKKEKNKNVYIHFVGDGPELNTYKNLVKKYSLFQYVTFYGALAGEKLTEVLNKADIAICSLGAHRVGISQGSFLKSREYLARGMPMVSSTKIDILPEGFKYCLYVPEDESSINISHIIEYYLNLLKHENLYEITRKIRIFAEDHCDISKTMQPVIEYISR